MTPVPLMVTPDRERGCSTAASSGQGRARSNAATDRLVGIMANENVVLKDSKELVIGSCVTVNTPEYDEVSAPYIRPSKLQ